MTTVEKKLSSFKKFLSFVELLAKLSTNQRNFLPMSIMFNNFFGSKQNILQQKKFGSKQISQKNGIPSYGRFYKNIQKTKRISAHLTTWLV